MEVWKSDQTPTITFYRTLDERLAAHNTESGQIVLMFTTTLENVMTFAQGTDDKARIAELRAMFPEHFPLALEAPVRTRQVVLLDMPNARREIRVTVYGLNESVQAFGINFTGTGYCYVSSEQLHDLEARLSEWFEGMNVLSDKDRNAIRTIAGKLQVILDNPTQYTNPNH